MTIKFLIPFFSLVLVSCDDDEKPYEKKTWEIGPIIDGETSSKGMPASTDAAFNFPTCDMGNLSGGPSVNYITKPSLNPLKGTMTLTYEVTGDGVIIGNEGNAVGGVVLYFQRKGDNWSYKGDYEHYRFWTLYDKRGLLTPGTYTLTASFDDPTHWTSAVKQSKLFEAAKKNPQRVGFTFGGNDGLGHGVCAKSGKSTFTIKSFTIG